MSLRGHSGRPMARPQSDRPASSTSDRSPRSPFRGPPVGGSWQPRRGRAGEKSSEAGNLFLRFRTSGPGGHRFHDRRDTGHRAVDRTGRTGRQPGPPRPARPPSVPSAADGRGTHGSADRGPRRPVGCRPGRPGRGSADAGGLPAGPSSAVLSLVAAAGLGAADPAPSAARRGREAEPRAGAGVGAWVCRIRRS